VLISTYTHFINLQLSWPPTPLASLLSRNIASRSLRGTCYILICRVVQKMATRLSNKALKKYRTATLFFLEKKEFYALISNRISE